MHVCIESKRKKNHDNKDIEKHIGRSDLLPEGVDNLLSVDHMDTIDCTSLGEENDLH